MQLNAIRLHFRNSGNKEERKEFIQNAIKESCTVNSVDKTFSLKPELM